MKRWLLPLWALGMSVALLGCSTSMPAMRVLGTAKTARPGPTFLGMPLRSGQLILTESPDATSYVFFLIPKKFYPFTHVAIISIEDGEPWVYDVTGEVKTIPLKRRLMDNVSGKMFRRRLYEYVSPNLYAEIYDPPGGADGEKVAAFVRQKFKEGVEFDSHFNFHDHSKLFCTELVSLAVQHGGGPPLVPEASNPNHSVVEGMKWLGVPPGEALAAGKFAEPSRFVGALGQFPTRTAAWTYFEAKRELFRRYTTDQRLGFLLSIDGNGAHRRSSGDHPFHHRGQSPLRHRGSQARARRSTHSRRRPQVRRQALRALSGQKDHAGGLAAGQPDCEVKSAHCAMLAGTLVMALVVPSSAWAQGSGPSSAPAGSGPAAGFPTGKENTPESHERPPSESPRSVKLFDQRRVNQSLFLGIGPLYYRRAGPRREGFARGTGELRLGVGMRTTWKPFYLGGVQQTILRVFDSKSAAWSILAHNFMVGLDLGPIQPEVRLGASLLTVDVFRGDYSVQMLTPRASVGFGIKLGKIKLDIQAHSEYLWRWFGPDYLIRGVSLGLRLDVPRPKSPVFSKESIH